VYVGDRLFEDVHGAQAAGLRAVHVPHSDIPDHQLGHTQGVPDAVVQRLADLLPIIDGWRAGQPRSPGNGTAARAGSQPPRPRVARAAASVSAATAVPRSAPVPAAAPRSRQAAAAPSSRMAASRSAASRPVTGNGTRYAGSAVTGSAPRVRIAAANASRRSR